MSEIPFSPDVRQDGFMTEARGTAQALGVAPFASPVTATSTLSTGQPPHDSNASATSASKPPLFKLDKFDGSTSLDTFLWKFHQLAHHMGWVNPTDLLICALVCKALLVKSSESCPVRGPQRLS